MGCCHYTTSRSVGS
ncbi:unnamed protein product [Linum tenue]|uniref:Uncharacterized protein n=1 Tax=Linum tenue TaxID=586396 RepID=A0AAV0R305_9ROSI|nr:unnamed protein product [Linum tenue]CAI0551904.1 unnamed protein product [Linum tenue]